MLKDERRMRILEAELQPLPVSDVIREIRWKSVRAMYRLELDLGETLQAHKEAILTNALRRCTNADPNYGTSWFFCRQRPIDTPTCVMRYAWEQLCHELLASQPIYVRAVCHYVIRCISDWERHRPPSSLSSQSCITSSGNGTKSRRPSSAPVHGCRAHTPTVTQDVAADSAATSAILTQIGGSGGCGHEAVTTAFSKSGNSDRIENGVGDVWKSEAAREDEILQDVVTFMQQEQSLIGASLPSTQPSTSSPLNLVDAFLPLVEVNSTLYSAQDFVTACIELNRNGYARHLTPEIKRKVLFGSDQIVP
jgi:hypothetical protein